MIKMPLNDIIDKISEKADISKSDIDVKIEQKLKQLSGLISKEGAAHIIANELGVKLFENVSGRLRIKNILTGMRDVETVGKVQQIFDAREFVTKDDRKGKVGSFVLADETGSIRIVCWGAQADNIMNLKKDGVVKIVSGYVRENNGRKEVHLNERGKLMIDPKDEAVGEVKAYDEANRKEIKDLTENDNDVEVLGTIVQVFEPRFFEVCPECGKRTKQSEDGFFCDAHNKIEPAYSYVMNAVLDDGSGTVRGVFFRNQALRLINKTEEEMLKYKDNPGGFDAVKTEMLGNFVKLIGRTSKNTMFDRIEFLANLVFTDVDPKAEMKKLEGEVKAEEVKAETVS